VLKGSLVAYLETALTDDLDIPLTPKAQAYLDTHDRRVQQGLSYFPFADNTGGFISTDKVAGYTKEDAEEVLRIVSAWYVKKNTFFHDVSNLQVKFSPHDVKQVVVQRMYEVFPKWTLSPQGWQNFFKVLLDPPVNTLNPEKTIPVWSGKRISRPANPQKTFFEEGTAVINTWSQPPYRSETMAQPDNNTAFDEFLEYVIPTQSEREMFRKWLAWSLKYEEDKPKWAVLLYSEKQGTGKSTLTDVVKALFGEHNTARTNGVGKLVGRFNKEVLEKKLVIVEEVEVKKGSSQANSLKSLITEDSTTVEAKGMPLYVEQIYCAFLMTSNHLPLWLEDSDRRFFVLEFAHQGFANGGTDYHYFNALCDRVYAQVKTNKGIKGIYDSLMKLEMPSNFGKKFDVTANKTAVMERIGELSLDVAKLLLEEGLDEHHIHFIPMEYASKLINKYSPRDVNTQNYLFSSLGWSKKKFAWDAGDQKRCWYREENPDYPTTGGKGVWLKGGIRAPVVNRVDDPTPKEKTTVEDGYEPVSSQIQRLRNLLNDK
jgi:hypothetical protein